MAKKWYIQAENPQNMQPVVSSKYLPLYSDKCGVLWVNNYLNCMMFESVGLDCKTITPV